MGWTPGAGLGKNSQGIVKPIEILHRSQVYGFRSCSAESSTYIKDEVRNLRLVEDTTKYLRNLDTESCYYDPKSRSMKDFVPATEDNLAEQNRPFKISKQTTHTFSSILAVPKQSNFVSQLGASLFPSVVDLARLQRANGSWNMGEEFVNLLQLKLSLEQIRSVIQKEIEISVPLSFTLDMKENLWATLLALAFLELYYEKEKKKWQLIYDKATEWLTAVLSKSSEPMEKVDSVINMISIAKKFFQECKHESITHV